MNYLSVGTFLLILLCVQVIAQFPTCPGRPLIQLCNRPSDWSTTGPRCTAGYRWWYDRSLRTCRLMWYRGCGGNSNRWCSQQECEQRCRR